MKAILKQLQNGQDLTLQEMADVVDQIMQGGCDEDVVSQLLLALRAKGESVDEIAGAATAMRRHMTPIRTQRPGVVDTCGTGGDGSGTFNISTAAALVAAAAAVPVAKHGNRSITSKSGSADVLAELGVNIEASVATVERCLDEVGICFCFAPQLHPSMKHVAPIRKRLGVPTIFNMLGPLCNPAGAPFQLLGVGRAALRQRLADALTRLDTTRALVVCGDDGLDEVTLADRTQVTEVRGADARSFTWSPEDFGLPTADIGVLRVDGPRQSAEVIRGVLSGARGPARDIVVLNAAAAIWTSRGDDCPPKQCTELASQAIDTGEALNVLERLAKASNS